MSHEIRNSDHFGIPSEPKTSGYIAPSSSISKTPTRQEDIQTLFNASMNRLDFFSEKKPELMKQQIDVSIRQLQLHILKGKQNENYNHSDIAEKIDQLKIKCAALQAQGKDIGDAIEIYKQLDELAKSNQGLIPKKLSESPATSISKSEADSVAGKVAKSLQPAVHDYLNQLEASGLFSGYISVAVDDLEVASQAFQPEQGSPFSESTLFNSCSVSKMLTSLAIYQLVEKGDINLDLPIDRYLTPEDVKSVYDSGETDDSLAEQMKKINVHHLLNHTAGVTGEGAPHIFETDQIGEHHYSNLGYNLLAKIISNVSKFSFQDYVQKEIFPKANMANALVYANAPDPALLPQQMTQLPSGRTELVDRYQSTPTENEKGRGNGCWEISAEDWIHFSKAIRKGDFSDYFKEMQTNSVPSEDGFYASGLEIHPTPHGRIVGHDGNSHGASAGFYLIEQENMPPITIVAISNFGQGRGGQTGLELANKLSGQSVARPLQQVFDLHACYKEFNDKKDLKKLDKILVDLLKKPNMKADYVLDMALEAVREGNLELAQAVINVLCSQVPMSVVEWKHRFGLALLEHGKGNSLYLEAAKANLIGALHDPQAPEDEGFRAASNEAIAKVDEAIESLQKK